MHFLVICRKHESSVDMHLIVLCGGLGTRLGALTKNMPKPMITIANRPFLEHVLLRLQGVEISGIELAVCFQWEKIRDYFGDYWEGIPIHYCIENQPLGTGGAIKNAMENAGLEEALIINGDTLFAINFVAFLQSAKSNKAATAIALRYVPDCSRYGRVAIGTDGQVLDFGEKNYATPGLINAGIYYQRYNALTSIKIEAFSFETDYLATQHRLLPMYGYPMDGYFVDIGIPTDLQRAQVDLIKIGLP